MGIRANLRQATNSNVLVDIADGEHHIEPFIGMMLSEHPKSAQAKSIINWLQRVRNEVIGGMQGLGDPA